MREENIAVVESYLDALQNNDLSRVLFADGLKFDDPIAGENTGVENFKAFLTGFLSAISDVKVFSHICEGEYVVTHYAVVTVFGIIFILQKIRVENGKISELHGFYDPRPIVGG